MRSFRKLAFVVGLLAWSVPVQAQIAFGTIGSGAGGTTSLAPGYPASISAGDLLVLCVGNKYPSNGPSTPADWTAVTNGQGSGGDGTPGVDTGDVISTVFVKVATGSESGSLTVTVTSGNAAYGFIARYTKTAASWATSTATNGADASSGTSWSVTGAADPEVATGDILVFCTGKNSDTPTFGSHAVTQTGVTFGSVTERGENGTSFGDDVGAVVADVAVTAGPSSAAPVYTATSSTNTAGSTAILRIREAAAAAGGAKLMLLGVGGS